MTDRPQESEPYTLVTSPTVRRQLAELLPEAVAFAADEFINGPLLRDPFRVGSASTRRWRIG